MTQNNSKVGFGGTVHFVNLSRNKNVNSMEPLNNKVLRPLIHQLKHHCGGKDVFHTINIGDIQIGVSSSYRPNKKIGKIDAFVSEYSIVGGNPITEKNVNDLIKWSAGIKKWRSGIKNLEKIQTFKPKMKETPVSSEKPSFISSLKGLLRKFV